MRCTPLPALRALACAALLAAAGAACADDYGDVAQMVRDGKFTQALERADAYLATNARDPQMRFLRGTAQTRAGQTEAAIETFTLLTQEYPELPEPYNNLAVIYANQGQLGQARAALEMAVRNNPNYAVAHENLGDIYLRLAQQAYGTSLQLNAGNAPLQRKQAATTKVLTPPAR